jgi:hypothetical protein
MDTNFKRPLSGLLDKIRMMKINISKQKYLPIETQEKTSSTPKKFPTQIHGWKE